MPLYDYLTPKLYFKRKFNHRQRTIDGADDSKISNRITTLEASQVPIINLQRRCPVFSDVVPRSPPDVVISHTLKSFDLPSECCVLSDNATVGKSFGYWTTRGYANSRIANSRTGRLADWASRGLVNSRMPAATMRA